MSCKERRLLRVSGHHDSTGWLVKVQSYMASNSDQVKIKRGAMRHKFEITKFFWNKPLAGDCKAYVCAHREIYYCTNENVPGP